MKLSEQSLSIIKSAIQKAVAKYTCNCEQTAVTDIHLQPDQTSGQLNVYNDDDEELANVMIEEWATYDGDDFLENPVQNERGGGLREDYHLEALLIRSGR